MTKLVENPNTIEKPAKELAEVLQRDEQDIFSALQVTPEEMEYLRKDPAFCAVMNNISINAPYLFEGNRDILRKHLSRWLR